MEVANTLREVDSILECKHNVRIINNVKKVICVIRNKH